MFDPTVGRFVSPDPTGIRDDEVNLYLYCHNNPVNYTDPTGLQNEDLLEQTFPRATNYQQLSANFYLAWAFVRDWKQIVERDKTYPRRDEALAMLKAFESQLPGLELHLKAKEFPTETFFMSVANIQQSLINFQSDYHRHLTKQEGLGKALELLKRRAQWTAGGLKTMHLLPGFDEWDYSRNKRLDLWALEDIVKFATSNAPHDQNEIDVHLTTIRSIEDALKEIPIRKKERELAMKEAREVEPIAPKAFSEPLVASERLRYYQNVGWIDTSHWDASSANILLNRVLSRKDADVPNFMKGREIPRAAEVGWNPRTYFIVKGELGQWSRGGGVADYFLIKNNLTNDDLKRVALGIFMELSHRFETRQGEAPFRWVSSSSYSQEDLVSNLISFYRAVDPSLKSETDLKAILGDRATVPETQALLARMGGSLGLPTNKNKTFRPVRDCPIRGEDA